MGDIQGVEKFLCTDKSNLGPRWKRWLSKFELYADSKGLILEEGTDKNKQRRRALLLHSAGDDVQDIFETLPNTGTIKEYQKAVDALNNYFTPSQNKIQARHLFKMTTPHKDETINEFYIRLKSISKTCDFGNTEDDQIRDHLVFHCPIVNLQRKFLEEGDKLTLEKVLDLAAEYTQVEHRLAQLSMKTDPTEANAAASDVNMIKHKSRPRQSKSFKPKGKTQNYQNKGSVRYQKNEQRCYRCNQTSHLSRDPNCPARNAKCGKCNFTGHYDICCRTKRQQVRYVETRNNESPAEEATDQPDYAFAVTNKQQNSGKVDLIVGGVHLPKVLVDSGSTNNIIDSKTWEQLKKSNVKCSSSKKVELGKDLFAYGQNDPLTKIGTFTTQVGCNWNNEKCEAEFTVIKENGNPILGKPTAEALKILFVGPFNSISAVSTTNFVDEFQGAFNGVGKMKDFQLHLHVDHTVEPIAQPVRRIPFSLHQKVDKKLDELLEMGIIEKAPDKPSKWISPLVVVPKSDGDVRICVDMRRANSAITRERHPIPNIEDVLNNMNGSTVFSKLDLKWGFHQIELDEESRDITTFVSHRGLFRYTRLMFGITSAPEKYQQIIKGVLRECKGAENIADDIIVHAPTTSEHDENLRSVLKKLQSVGLTLNADKCQFRLPKLTFFGHDLGKNGISPSEEKVSAILNAERPTNISELRSFLGLVQYSAKFLPNFSEVSEPLRKLTRKNCTFVWSTEQDNAFEKLKTMITQADTLAYFKVDAETRIISDAGPAALGAVLTQKQDGVWRVVSYASRNLTTIERKYHQTEREALAIVWACERFNLYVFGRKFELETDCKSLQYLFRRTSKPSARIERWILRLQGYDYTVVHRPGKTNIADALSRLNNSKSVDTHGENQDIVYSIAKMSTPHAMSTKEIERESENDPELKIIRECIKTGNWDPAKHLTSYTCVRNELTIIGQLILRGTRIVIPTTMRGAVLQLAHEGHQGIVKMKSRLRSKVWWPKMDKDSEKVCRTCHGCQAVSQSFSPPEPMKRSEPPTGPWQDVAVDLMGPMPTGENLFVVVDYYSRFFEVVIMKTTTTSKIIEALIPMFTRYGYPFTLKSDNGSQFVSTEFNEFLEECGIQHITSPPLWPQANGEVERQNRTILKSLKIAHAEGKQWKLELPKFLMAYRSTPHSVTGVTPAYLMFGRELRTKLPELRREEIVNNEGVREADWENKLKGKIYADENRNAKPNNINTGDKVLLKNTQKGKLQTNFEYQPYTVVHRNDQEITVESQNGTQYTRNTSFVKPFVEPTDSDAQNDESEIIENNNQPRPTAAEKRERPTREVKRPAKYDDYVSK